MTTVTGATLRLILDYCYSGIIKITQENVSILLETAHQYGFKEIKEECSTYLEQTI